MWQDTVIALCQLAFLPALLPSIISKDKPAFSTSLMNAVIISILGLSMASLGLWFAAISTGVTAAAWVILAIQKWDPLESTCRHASLSIL